MCACGRVYLPPRGVRPPLRRYDHQERVTSKDAQAHPYFYPVRHAEASAAGAK